MLVKFHIILIINSLELQFGGLIIKLLGYRAIGRNLRTKCIILLLIIIEAKKPASLISLAPCLIINLDGNLNPPSAILLLFDCQNSSIIPSPKRIKCIEDITLLDGFPPLEGFTL
jgi:hypothetical protein